MAAGKRKPRLAVWKFASCDDCQLSLLDCEDELLALATSPIGEQPFFGCENPTVFSTNAQ
jgi:hypothetical protein